MVQLYVLLENLDYYLHRLRTNGLYPRGRTGRHYFEHWSLRSAPPFHTGPIMPAHGTAAVDPDFRVFGMTWGCDQELNLNLTTSASTNPPSITSICLSVVFLSFMYDWVAILMGSMTNSVSGCECEFNVAKVSYWRENPAIKERDYFGFHFLEWHGRYGRSLRHEKWNAWTSSNCHGQSLWIS